MATYRWSELSDGQTIAPFDPSVDVLFFDDSSIRASLVQVGEGSGEVSFAYAGRTVKVAMDLRAVTTSNVRFNVGGDQLLVGDNSVSSAGDDLDNALSPTNPYGYYQLIGLGGNDSLSAAGVAGDRIDGGAGDDYIQADRGNDTLLGGDGNDTLNGGSNDDSMVGGPGDDLYIVQNRDQVSEGIDGSGIDTVESAKTFVLGDGFENLALTGSAFGGTGNALANSIVGNAIANVLFGLSGVDTLTGGGGRDTLDGGSGGDSMVGGAENDVYIVDSAADITVELEGEGTDFVQSNLDHQLAENVESLRLVGGANRNGTGNALSNLLVGNNGNNELRGEGGNDVLDGGAGADTLIGGTGNDLYILATVGDVAMEGEGATGTDVVRTSFNYTLGASLEVLALTGTAVEGTGNPVANLITGNAVGNILSGLGGNDTLRGFGGDDTLAGGAADDRMEGGTGNDVYVVTNAGDVTVELAGQGTDLVQSSISRSLADNVDNLTLTGTGNTAGTGNALANFLLGNSGNNELRGGVGNDTLDGAGGADTVIGGAGDDLYVVATTDDTVAEGAGGSGVDTVRSAFSYTLGSTLENLVLEGIAVNGTGNRAANAITGNGQANVLLGLVGDDAINGGPGNDTIHGGGGNDSLNGGSEADMLSGGDGSDVLVYALANANAHGGAGTDKLQFLGDALDLTLIPDGEITGIEIIDLALAASNVTLGLADVLEQPGDTLRIDGGAGDSFTLIDAGNWSAGANQEIDGTMYRAYTNSTATLLVDVDIAG